MVKKFIFPMAGVAALGVIGGPVGAIAGAAAAFIVSKLMKQNKSEISKLPSIPEEVVAPQVEEISAPVEAPIVSKITAPFVEESADTDELIKAVVGPNYEDCPTPEIANQRGGSFSARLSSKLSFKKALTSSRRALSASPGPLN